MATEKQAKPVFPDPESQAAFEADERKRLKFFQQLEQSRRHRKLLEKRVPCDSEMERELLGTLMLFWETPEVEPAWKLHRRDFYLEENAMLFEALIAAKAASIPVNSGPVFTDWLKESGWWLKIAKAGGFESGHDMLDWLFGLVMPSGVVSTHVGYYCAVLRKHRLLRAWKSVAEEIAEACCKPEATAETLLKLASERFGQLKKIDPLRTV